MKFKEFIEICKSNGIKHAKLGSFEVEFYPTPVAPMALDPVSLSKAFSDSMPPDTAMLFASSEDLNDQQESTLNQSDGKLPDMN
jgi:hypothetical protein